MTLEKLKEQLLALEQDLEIAKANLYRIDGAVVITRKMIADLEKIEAL